MLMAANLLSPCITPLVIPFSSTGFWSKIGRPYSVAMVGPARFVYTVVKIIIWTTGRSGYVAHGFCVRKLS